MKRNAAVTATLASALLVAGLVLTSCGSNNSDSARESTKSEETTTDSSGQDVTTAEFGVSWKAALAKAQGKFDGDLAAIALAAADSGSYEYTIGLLSDKQKYAVRINADNGKLSNEKTSTLDRHKHGSQRREKRIALDKIIPLEQAADSARQDHRGTINRWKLAGTSSGPRYEFDIHPHGKPHSAADQTVRIDAHTGKKVAKDGHRHHTSGPRGGHHNRSKSGHGPHHTKSGSPHQGQGRHHDR